MTRNRRRRGAWRLTWLVAVLAAVVGFTAACGGTSGSSSSGGDKDASSWADTAYPKADTATLEKMATTVINSKLDVKSLATEVQNAMMIASRPLTDAQRKVYNSCLAKNTCETGTGKYTLAIVEDQVNTFYSMTRAEAVAAAIKSGAVAKIIYFSSDINVQQYLADWRSAIGQGADLILSNFGALGNQAGPVIEQAKAKGIPIVNGCCALAPDVAKKLTVRVDASICKMWENGGAEQLYADLKSKGKDPTYGLFTGPAGNAFAASWQPCVKAALDKAGLKQVYDGNTQWTTQGTVKAVAALRASGKNPSVIIYDTYADDFIHAYMDAHDKNMPMIVITASNTVGTAKAYQEAKAAGYNAQLWMASPIVWLPTVAFSTALEIKDGKKPSGDVVDYPMHLTDVASIIDKLNLNLNNAAFLGSTLAPQDQEESLKH